MSPLRSPISPLRKQARKRLLKQGMITGWGGLCVMGGILAIRNQSFIPLMLLPLPLFVIVGLWGILYVLVFIHELGHVIIGALLGFPVRGIEIGHFPHKMIQVKKLRFHLSLFPRAGKTLLGFSTRSFSRIEQLYFFLGGMAFETLLFVIAFYYSRNNMWLELFLGLLYLDQFFFNIYPSYEQGQPANDGAFLIEILFQKRLPRNVMRFLERVS